MTGAATLASRQPQALPDTPLTVNPVAPVNDQHGQHSKFEIAQAYFSLSERPIPLCDPTHTFVTPQHRDGYQRM